MRSSPGATPLRVLIVDDYELVRQGLVALLERHPGFQVVAQAGSVAEAIEMAGRYQPDLVVMDVRLPDGSGIEAAREIRVEHPQSKVLATRHARPGQHDRMPHHRDLPVAVSGLDLEEPRRAQRDHE
ncbi:MAG: response regulator transcription factor [Candidatus Limnocylindrales bacterium]